MNPTAQPLPRNRRHTALRDRLNTPDDPVTGEVGQLLASLMRLRSEADYQLAPPLRYRGRTHTPEQLMRTALAVGEDLVEALESFSPGEAEDGCSCPEVYSVG